MNSLLILCATAVLCLVVGYWLGRLRRFTRRYVESTRRGPNADSEYLTITVGGRDYWFTDEQLNVARTRAERLSGSE